MHIELVTDVDRLQQFVGGWDVLADRAAQPRAGGSIFVAWARHMMGPDSEPRVWIATDGAEVIGVLPMAAETMARGRLRLLPPATDMTYGTVPLAHPDRAGEVAEAVAADFAETAEAVELVSIFWLPEGSPWIAALGGRLAGLDWVGAVTANYRSYYTSIASGMEAWLEPRHTEFKRTVRRRARRAAEEGFRIFTTEDPAEITARLPHLQTFYRRRQDERGGEGYRFDDDMIRAIGTAMEISTSGRFALSVFESDDVIIGMQLVLRAGTRMSCWITGFDSEWSRLGPGIAVLLEALAAGVRAGCEIVDLGVGDQSYKDEFQDASFPLQSVTWCRPRLARLLQLGSEAASATPTVADVDVTKAAGVRA